MANEYAFPSEHLATPSRSGMTLRDYFAAQAMQGLFGRDLDVAHLDAGTLAVMAYEYADAMMEVRAE